MPRSGGIVLFIDDSDDDRFLLSEAWRTAGIKVPLKEFGSGSDAVAYLEGYDNDGHVGRPVLVLLDLSMPGMNGFEVLEWLRKSERWKRLPVIIVTASAHPGDVQRAYEDRTSAFVVKPSTLAQLVELVHAIDLFWLKFNEYPA